MTIEQDFKQILTTNEAIRELYAMGVPVPASSFHRLITIGIVPAKRVGVQWMIHRENLPEIERAIMARPGSPGRKVRQVSTASA